MSKGGGVGRGGSGTRLRASDIRARASFMRTGLRGRDVAGRLPMRAESFAHLRGGGGTSGALPVTIKVRSDGTRAIVDGRHRITVARERGQSTIQARVIGEGPKGGVRWSYTGRIKI